MRLLLQSPVRKTLLVVLSLALLVCFMYSAARQYKAALFSTVPEKAAVERAVQLDPTNAEYRWLLGRYRFFDEQEIGSAITDYRAAIALNPYSAKYWLDLSLAYYAEGELDAARKAVAEAMRIDPTTPNVILQSANTQLAGGDVDVALHQFRQLLVADRSYTPQTIQLCWRATHDAERIFDEGLPATRESHIALLTYLALQDETDDAARVWARMVEAKDVIEDPQSVFPYIERLLTRRDVVQASEVWHDLVNASTALKLYQSPDDQVANGGFDQPILNGGFDWRQNPSPSVVLHVDNGNYHSAPQSIAVEFSGQAVAEIGLFQYLVLEPDTNYEFSAWVKADKIEGAGGPRFAIDDASSGSRYLLSEDVRGTHGWKQIKCEFHTQADARLAVLRIIRVPGSTLVRGKLWIDDVHLVRK